jgi:hypothetical protein
MSDTPQLAHGATDLWARSCAPEIRNEQWSNPQ